MQTFIDSGNLGLAPLELGDQTWTAFGRLTTFRIYHEYYDPASEEISIPENIGNLDSLTSFILEQKIGKI